MTTRFGELQGFNEIVEYFSNMLDIIENYKKYSKNSYRALMKFSNPEYVYIGIRAFCSMQSMIFCNLIEEGVKIENPVRTSVEMVKELLKTLKMDGKEELPFAEKERIFRNCLAHGRYSLEIENDDVIIGINDSTNNVNAKIPFRVYYKLCDIYQTIFQKPVLNIRNDFWCSSQTNRNVANKAYKYRLINETKKYYYKEKPMSTVKSRERIDWFIDSLFQAIGEYESQYGEQDSVTKIEVLGELIESEKNEMEIEYSEEISSLTLEEKELFSQYIDFFGIGEFKEFREQLVSKRDSKNIMDFETLAEVMVNIINFIHNPRINNFTMKKTIEFFDTIKHLNEINSEELVGSKSADQLFQALHNQKRVSTQLGITRSQVLKSRLQSFYFIRPILYSNALIAMLNYTIGYTKEVNSNYGNRLFDYKNLTLPKFNIIYDNQGDKAIKVIDPKEKYMRVRKNAVIEKENARRKLKEILSFNDKKGKDVLSEQIAVLKRKGYNGEHECIKILEKISLEKNNLLNYANQIDSEEKFNALNQFISDCLIVFKSVNSNSFEFNIIKTTLKDLESAKNKLISIKKQNQIIEETTNFLIQTDLSPYEDSTTLFNHIRNSITHAYFSIDYEEAFKRRKLNLIKFNFKDFSKGQGDNKVPFKTFEMEITVGDIINLVRSIRNRINESIQTNQLTNLCNVNLNDTFDQLGIVRYDITKYDSGKYPIRPNHKDFEKAVGDDILMVGMTSNIGREIQTLEKDKKEK